MATNLECCSLMCSMETLKIFQNHYPERLKHAYLMFSPWFFSATWKVLSPFIDAVTKAKISFHKGSPAPGGALSTEMLKVFDADQLFEEYGGSVTDYTYDRFHYLVTSSPKALVTPPKKAAGSKAPDKAV